jgi:hypothetical protein
MLAVSERSGLAQWELWNVARGNPPRRGHSFRAGAEAVRQTLTGQRSRHNRTRMAESDDPYAKYRAQEAFTPSNPSWV